MRKLGKFLLCLMTFVFCVVCINVEPAYALTAGWTKSGTCEWKITDGELVIRPLDGGAEGTLANWGNGNPPWYSQSVSITSARFEGTVHAVTCYRMFYYCQNLTTFDVSGFDTSSVTNMSYMFNNCKALTSLDVSSFDTSSVASMNTMFSNCEALTSLDVSGFDTSSVTDMGAMFNNCEALTSLDVSGFDTSSVTNMSYMFNNCKALISLNVLNWDTSNVTNMSYMFYDCERFVSLDVSNWDTNNVTNMSHMFFCCSALNTLDVSGFDTSSVTDMSYMFYNCCLALTAIDVSSFDTSKVTTMNSMFCSCSALVTLDVSGFDTSSVTTMKAMFDNCRSLAALDVSSFDTSSVASMNTMFSNCKALTSLDVSGFDTSSVTDMGAMFSNCEALTSLDVSGFDTSSVRGMGYMFSNCKALTSLDVSGFDTSSVTNMRSMFFLCQSLSTVKLGNNFRFDGKGGISNKAILPTPPTATTTGKWVNLEKDPDASYTPAELRSAYDGSESMTGTWVWEELGSTFRFNANGGAGETMPSFTVRAGESVPIPDSAYMYFDHLFVNWNTAADGSGTTYVVGQNVSGKDGVREVIDLYAQWEQRPHDVDLVNGEFFVDVPAGVRLSIDDLPAGMAYQVFEETADGWTLVSQTNSTGYIEALATAAAAFENQYTPNVATAQIVGTKTLDGYAPADGQFTFELVEDGHVVQTVTNGTAGAVVFNAIEYDEVGTHTYTVREVRGSDDGITYDGRTFEVRVSVTNADGKLMASVSYPNGYPTFENKTNPGSLTLKKIVEGQTNANKDDEFTFTIRLTNPNGQSLDEIHMTKH